MKTVLALLALCLSTAMVQVHAEGCLNDDPKRGSYPSGDPRNSTYVRYSSGAGSAGTGQAGTVGAIGGQLQNIMERRNADEDADTAAWRKQRDADTAAGYDSAVYDEMAAMGWTGITVAEAHGGSDFGWMSLGLVVEECAKTLTASPLGRFAT